MFGTTFALVGLFAFLALGLIVIPNTFRREIVTTLTTPLLTGQFADMNVSLFSNNFIPHPGMVLGDLTKCTFGGYADVAGVNFGTTFTNSLNQAVGVSDTTCQFTATDSVTPEIAYGYFVTDTAGTKLLFAERFDDPKAFSKLGDALAITPVFSFGQ